MLLYINTALDLRLLISTSGLPNSLFDGIGNTHSGSPLLYSTADERGMEDIASALSVGCTNKGPRTCPVSHALEQVGV